MLCRAGWCPRLCSSMGSCKKSLSMKWATRHSLAMACSVAETTSQGYRQAERCRMQSRPAQSKVGAPTPHATQSM